MWQIDFLSIANNALIPRSKLPIVLIGRSMEWNFSLVHLEQITEFSVNLHGFARQVGLLFAKAFLPLTIMQVKVLRSAILLIIYQRLFLRVLLILISPSVRSSMQPYTSMIPQLCRGTSGNTVDFLNIVQDNATRERMLFGVGYVGDEIRRMAELRRVFKNKS